MEPAFKNKKEVVLARAEFDIISRNARRLEGPSVGIMHNLKISHIHKSTHNSMTSTMIVYKFSKGMKILFVGINPHHGSFRRGVPFSNNKMFWYLLNRAYIINEKVSDLKDEAKLRQIYSKRFNQIYRLGFLNLINRPTHDVSQLRKGEENTGRKRVLSIVREYEPLVVCFIGKISFEKFSHSKDFSFGWQNEDIFKSKTFVMHFPIRGKAEIRVCELKAINKFLTRRSILGT